jgi:ADP-heptose:LPS heptosyltransferase
MNYVIRRGGALGDVLCVTPIIRRLRREQPECGIIVETQCPDAIAWNPDLGPVEEGAPEIMINLDMAYEKRPNMHVVDAYMLEAFGDPGDPAEKSIVFPNDAKNKLPGVAIIHAAQSWPSRTLPFHFWDHLALQLQVNGLRPLFVGKGGDYMGPAGLPRLNRQPSLIELATLIAGASVFIGVDSALLHLAGGTETSIVGLYTCVRGAYRAPYRHGQLGWNMAIVEAEIECRGCLERQPAPVTSLSCARGDNACVRLIDPDLVLSEALRLVSPDPLQNLSGSPNSSAPRLEHSHETREGS